MKTLCDTIAAKPEYRGTQRVVTREKDRNRRADHLFRKDRGSIQEPSKMATSFPLDLSAESLASAINTGFIQLLLLLSQDALVLAFVALSIGFALFKIRKVTVPFVKLAVVYYALFLATLAALYGPEDLMNLTSLKHVRRSTKAALIASVLCFALGLMTPKRAREALE